MTTPDPTRANTDNDDATAQEILSTPADEEPSPEESALAQPQYPTTS